MHIRVSYSDASAVEEIAASIDAYMPNSITDIVVVCIGTDRSTGDSLGPLVGTKLSKTFPDLQILGTLDNPVHGANLHEVAKELERISTPGRLVLAVDAALGEPKNIGDIVIKDEPLFPGSGLGRSLPPIGDISITGVVNVSGYMEFLVLQSTRLSLVMSMADVIAEAIEQAIYSRIEEVVVTL